MPFGLFDKNTTSRWNNKGVALFKKGKYDEAIQACDEAIKLNPNIAEPWNNKGLALQAQGKYDEALQMFNRAIELKPNLDEAWSNKGLVLHKQNKNDEAMQAVDKAIELNPKLAAAQIVKRQIAGISTENIVKMPGNVSKNTTNMPENESKNISKILQKRGIPSEKVIIAIEGKNGQIILTDAGVIIGREGFSNKLLVGFTKGEKFLPYKNIAGVQFKEPGLTWGYIQFTLPGGIESRGGSWDAAADENTVIFRKGLERFRKIRSIVEEKQYSNVPTPQTIPTSSKADELTKLATLKRDGTITEEEFEQLKKDLLSSH